MNLLELRNLVRTRIRDKVKPYLCSDDEINANLNEAQREACIRAQLIEDDEITQIEINTAERRYSLDQRIIDVFSISIGADGQREFTDGWTLTEGQLILDRFPGAADTLTLHCLLLPSADMEGDEDEPEIRPVFHSMMADWAISLCFSAPDADLFNQSESDRYAAKFTQSFGERPNVLALRNRRDKSARTVANNGYI